MNWTTKTYLLLTCFLLSTLSTFAQIDTEFWFAAPDISSSTGLDRPAFLRIASFKEAGVTMLSINPVGPNAIQNIETLKEMIS